MSFEFGSRHQHSTRATKQTVPQCRCAGHMTQHIPGLARSCSRPTSSFTKPSRGCRSACNSPASQSSLDWPTGGTGRARRVYSWSRNRAARSHDPRHRSEARPTAGAMSPSAGRKLSSLSSSMGVLAAPQITLVAVSSDHKHSIKGQSNQQSAHPVPYSHSPIVQSRVRQHVSVWERQLCCCCCCCC